MALTTAIFVGESKEWIPDLVAKAKQLQVNEGNTSICPYVYFEICISRPCTRHISIVNLKGSFVVFYAVRPAFFYIVMLPRLYFCSIFS